MKNIKLTIGIFLIAFFAGGCSDLMEEKPRSSFTTDFFNTPEGVQGELTYLYANLRQIYGLYYYAFCEGATDEYTWAQSADNNNKDIDLSPGVGNGVTPSTDRSDVLWNNIFPTINTASGIIENGETAGIAESLLSEARFFRAFSYFMMVQTYGGVPLDLGAGELKFNTTSSSVAIRNTVPEVYTKAIFPDLLTASQNLPASPRATGAATQTLARLYLAKAYLTYGWWLQNPNNIPTYPDCPRTDPDGHNAAWYFQQAYEVAVGGIRNPGTFFALQPTFYDVNNGANDRNSEILFFADHTEDATYNNASLSYASGSGGENDCGWFVMWNYTQIGNGVPVQREAAQWGGRPWTRMAPPIEVFTNTFADKTNDSRYDGTFTTVLRGNWNLSGASAATINSPTFTNANNIQVAPGGAILSFLNEDNPAVVYPTGDGPASVGAGTLTGRSDYVITPSHISRVCFPGLWKLGPYRTKNSDGSPKAGSLGEPNGAGTRPFNIAKFSELYFIAAEAAVKGATGDMSARDLLNVIRARAGKQTFSNALNQTVSVDNSAAMIAATPAAADIDIDYIMAERSREYFGEGYRWYDLVRTQTWSKIAGTYTICGYIDAKAGDHTPVTVTRTIDAKNFMYYLRPIPQTQINSLTVDEATKAAFQNPGY